MGKKQIILIILTLILLGVLGIGAYKINSNGVTINGVKIKLTELENYRSIVESNMETPDIITDGTDDMEQCLKWTLEQDYEFNVQDIFGTGISIPIVCEVDKSKLWSLLEDMNSELPATVDAYVDTERKEVVPEIYGEQIDIGAAIIAICDAAANNSTATLSDFVIIPSVFVDNLQDGVDNYWNHKNWTVGYENSNFFITVPDEALSLASDGSFEIVSYDFIDESVSKIAKAYNTVGRNHIFTTHNGENITVSGGTLGNEVDTETERTELINLFENGISPDNKRIPSYSTYVNNGFDTYIEVSLEEQHVWLYENGELIMDSACVTGTKDTSNATPAGFWYMDIVMPGKTLYPDGPESGTWVDRWMRFTPDGCGLHDASWRSKFGGNIYTYNGSHGCVNLPVKFAYDLYEHVYLGMPVIVY